MQSISSSKKTLLVNTNIKIERTHLQQQQLPHPIKSKQPLHKYHTNSIFSEKHIDNNNTKQSSYQIPLVHNKALSKQIPQSHKLKLTTPLNNSNTNIIKKKINNKVMKFLSFNNNRTIHNSNT